MDTIMSLRDKTLSKHSPHSETELLYSHMWNVKYMYDDEHYETITSFAQDWGEYRNEIHNESLMEQGEDPEDNTEYFYGEYMDLPEEHFSFREYIHYLLSQETDVSVIAELIKYDQGTVSV